jgi:hypothetical protein
MKAKAKAMSEAIEKLRYLPQRLNTIQNLIFSALCLLKDGDAEDVRIARISLKESHEYLRMVITDIEEILKKLESS